jgi:Rod binding domain-containing protein
MSGMDVSSLMHAERVASGRTLSTPSTANSQDPATVADHKLRKAAGEFESMLLANLWKSMKTTFTQPDDGSGDPAHDSLEDWGIQAMSDAVGKNGGLGIAKLILKHLEPTITTEKAK